MPILNKLISITIVFLFLYPTINHFVFQRRAGDTKQAGDLDEPGCSRAGCGQICGNLQAVDKMYPVVCSQGDDCYHKYGECVHYGNNCDWKPEPGLAGCLAKARNISPANNPLHFSDAYCNRIRNECFVLSNKCIKEYLEYCRIVTRDFHGVREESRGH